MDIKTEFKQLYELVEPYSSTVKTIKQYKVLTDRLWSVIIGMMISSNYTTKQISKIIKDLKDKN